VSEHAFWPLRIPKVFQPEPFIREKNTYRHLGRLGGPEDAVEMVNKPGVPIVDDVVGDG
jgi:hypothetical protein